MSAVRKKHNAKIIKYKKTHFNIGTIAFIMLLFYIVFVSFNYLKKEHLGIYEVTEKNMSDNNIITGIALREETVYKADTSGTIAYYNAKSKKVSNGAPLYSIDQTGALSDFIAGSMDGQTASDENINDIRTAIHNYKTAYNNASYSDVEDFKYTIESSILSIVSQDGIDQLVNRLNNSGGKYTVETASESGIVTYWSDGMENIKREDITSSTFDMSDYRKHSFKTTDSVNTGAVVCKIATSEKWNIIVRLDSEQYAALDTRDNKIVSIRFCSDNQEASVSYDLYVQGTDYFACIYMDRYLARYLDDRFINIELLLNSVEGLKIPNSSIFEKNCYKIPAEYLTKGGQSTKDILLYETYNEDNEKTYVEIDTFCMKDEKYVYIDTDLIQPGTVFFNPGSQKTFTAEEMTALKGVYNVNKGYCQFKYVNVLYENQEYSIVAGDTRYGLSVYDHIVINPELIGEDDIIF